MMAPIPNACPESTLIELIAALSEEGNDAFIRLELLVETYPDDARLHFLRGSLLIGAGRAIEAHAALSRAVALAPDYALARFQLGFFELTSGEPQRALRTWQPLGDQLPADHYLARFTDGLQSLIMDRFAETVDALAAGIVANTENLPLNADMQLIIEECRNLMDPAAEEGEASATSLLLDQFASRKTMH